MLRRFFQYQRHFIEKRKSLHRLRPFISAVENFCFELPDNVKIAPFIRDAIDVKRWMFLVIVALLPAIFMAIWNSGVQKMVYASGNFSLMQEYLASSHSFATYFDFVFKEHRYLTILSLGAGTFFPLMIISYLVGGVCETVVACIRGHEIAEGFLVTGMLYPLILPPTLPYWMAALGIAFGIVVGKELFGGTGMNILNPALTARAFLFFTFPGKMTGDVWVGTNPTVIQESLQKINQTAHMQGIDGITQATALGNFNSAITEIKRIHVDAIASNTIGNEVGSFEALEKHFQQWKSLGHSEAILGNLSPLELHSFVTSEKGLNLAPDLFPQAYHFADTYYGTEHFTNGNLFFGNILGSLGETSTLACLLGALFLIYTGIASWRVMLACGLGAFLFASLFEWCAHLGPEGGAWNAARYAMPAYRHLLMGGLAFGFVFMATDPVSGPTMNSAKWIYGILIGIVTILIRLINPAYPEGVMLAILFGNVFAPLLDHYAIRYFRRAYN